jgi:hypothetical protein
MAGRAETNRINGRKGGRPKKKVTLDKEAARALVRERVIADLGPVIDAQLANAKGLAHFFLRDPKTKQFVLITDPKQIALALNMGEQGSYYWIHTKDPSIQAATLLLAYALDKPKEQMDVQVSGTVELIERLQRARQRAAG